MVKKASKKTRATAVVTHFAKLNVFFYKVTPAGAWVINVLSVNYHTFALARALQKKSPF